MLWLYNFGIFSYGLILRLFALFNPKARLFLQGRAGLFSIIAQKINPAERCIWFHFASLGEFEQGRPVLEKMREIYPHKKIVITFFSPSGYEVRKNYSLADAVFYLPLDTRSNAQKFVALLHPEIAVFTKYDFWHHYFKALHAHKIPLFIVSGIFRPDQVFFKWYGGFFRSTLRNVSLFFVQNEESVRLLKSIHLNNVILSGDTRFDRVSENANVPKKLESIEVFLNEKPALIAGSTWPEDERLLASLIAEKPDWKFIIAPHEIDKSHIDEIKKLIPAAVLYSTLQPAGAFTPQVLIIDNIGLLSSLYQYGTLAYIGGGFGAGIHNTLEAAAFGLPVIFGPHYDKFQEAKDLIQLGAAISISDGDELKQAFQAFIQDPKPGETAKAYVQHKKGATPGIIKEMESYLS